MTRRNDDAVAWMTRAASWPCADPRYEWYVDWTRRNDWKTEALWGWTWPDYVDEMNWTALMRLTEPHDSNDDDLMWPMVLTIDCDHTLWSGCERDGWIGIDSDFENELAPYCNWIMNNEMSNGINLNNRSTTQRGESAFTDGCDLTSIYSVCAIRTGYFWMYVRV